MQREAFLGLGVKKVIYLDDELATGGTLVVMCMEVIR